MARGPRFRWVVLGTTALLSALIGESGAAATDSATVPSLGQQPQATLNVPAPTATDFGIAVALSGDTIVAGSNDTTIRKSCCVGEAFIYAKQAKGWTAPPVILKSPGKGSTGFGGQVAVFGSTVVVGSGRNVYLYVKGKSGWPTVPTVTVPDPVRGDTGFGQAVGISGNTLVVGSYYFSPARNNVGIAYVYRKGRSGWPTTPTVTLPDPGPGTHSDWFGYSLAISNTILVVSAQYASPVPASTSTPSMQANGPPDRQKRSRIPRTRRPALGHRWLSLVPRSSSATVAQTRSVRVWPTSTPSTEPDGPPPQPRRSVIHKMIR